MLKLRTVLAVSTFFVSSIFLHAQTSDPKSIQAGSGTGVGIGAGNGSAHVEANIGASSGVVETFYKPGGTPGQPFSADVIDETDKSLADGNHIHRENKGRFFRDSQGRTRSETEVASHGPGGQTLFHVMIVDPVEGRSIFLDPEHKTATIRAIGKRTPNAESAVPAGKPGLNATPAGKPDLIAPPPPPTRTQALLLSNGQARSESRKFSSENIGTMDIEGFSVNGTRYTETLAAGAIGNEKPLVTTYESWHSPDLKIVLLRSSEGPETGKQVYKLVNIRTGDPDPMLFQVPADFEVRETPQR